MDENSLPIACFILVLIMVLGTLSMIIYRIVEEKRKINAEQEARLEKLMESRTSWLQKEA